MSPAEYVHVTPRKVHALTKNELAPTDHPYYAKEDTVFHNDEPHLIIRASETEGRFHLAPTYPVTGPNGFIGYDLQPEDTAGLVYRPPHPDMKPDDILTATYVEDTGTYWLFAPCSPHEQIDFAAEVKHFAESQFDNSIQAAVSNTTAATEAADRIAKHSKANALIEFADEVGGNAHTRVVEAVLGHFHKDQHNDHKRDLTLSAIGFVNNRWKNTESHVLKQTLISNIINAISQGLSKAHAIEWRHARARRLAAAGGDPIEGYEYCYTKNQTAAAITDETQFPDPNWNFDQLRDGEIERGGREYFDAQPESNIFQTWIIRFRRPVPAGTQPGADIGSVPWIQESAYSGLKK